MLPAFVSYWRILVKTERFERRVVDLKILASSVHFLCITKLGVFMLKHSFGLTGSAVTVRDKYRRYLFGDAPEEKSHVGLCSHMRMQSWILEEKAFLAASSWSREGALCYLASNMFWKCYLLIVIGASPALCLPVLVVWHHWTRVRSNKGEYRARASVYLP